MAAGDLLPDGVLRVELGARLVDVRELDGVPEPERPVVRLLLAGDHAEEGRLPRAVRADHADYPCGRQGEREVLEEEAVTEALGDSAGLDHDVAEARARRDVDLDAVELDALLLREELLVCGQARVRLRMAGSGAHLHPLELAGEGAAAG